MRKSLWLMVGVLTVTAMVCSLPGTSRADSITVTVNGTQYFVTTVTGTFTDNMAQLESTPWWGDSTLAQAIATAVADDIGTPNEFNGEEGFGPLFAWDFDAVDAFVFFKGVISPETIPDIDLKFTKFTWGEGSAISAAEPSLSVLFAGCVLLLTVGKAIFDEARRRRQAS